MQPCNRIYYSTVHWRLNMFRATHRSSSGALTVFAESALHTHVVTGRSHVLSCHVMTWLRPVTTCVCKPEAANSQSSWWWAVCRSKHLEPSMNGGIINSITRLHLVGYFYWVIRYTLKTGTCRFWRTTMVTRTRLSVTFILTLPVLLNVT